MSKYVIGGEIMTNIGNAIREKLKTSELYTPKQMPDAILSIEGGGGGGDTPTAEEVYRATRPSDWLPMPTPNTDEIYMLLLIPDGSESYINFLVSGTSQLTIDYGTVVNGEFVADVSQREYAAANTSERHATTKRADDFGNLTSDGFKQVMVKIYGGSIRNFLVGRYTGDTTACPVYDCVTNAPNWTSMSSAFYYCRTVRYVNFLNARFSYQTQAFEYCSNLIAILNMNFGAVSNTNRMFYNCQQLKSLPETLNTEYVTDMSYMFYECNELLRLPKLSFARVQNMNNAFYNCMKTTFDAEYIFPVATKIDYMFYGCRKIEEITINIPKVTSMNSTFSLCTLLKRARILNSGAVTSMNSVFSQCKALTEAPEFDYSSVTSMSSPFQNSAVMIYPDFDYTKITSPGSTLLAYMPYLRKAHLRLDRAVNITISYPAFEELTIDSKNDWGSVTINLSAARMTRNSLVKLINSLPQCTGTGVLNIKGNPGTAQLTSEEKAVATGKGWSLTV